MPCLGSLPLLRLSIHFRPTIQLRRAPRTALLKPGTGKASRGAAGCRYCVSDPHGGGGCGSARDCRYDHQSLDHVPGERIDRLGKEAEVP